MKTLIALIVATQLFGCAMTPEQSATFAVAMQHAGQSMQQQADILGDYRRQIQPQTYNVNVRYQTNPYGFYMAQ